MGNFRKNIFWSIKTLSGAEAAIPELKNYVPVITSGMVDIPLTIIFVNSIVHGCHVYDMLIAHYPASFHPQIQLLHSFRSQITKSHVMHRVMRESRGILICTEIAALVSDSFFT
jgi:superfamily II DNA/RNA helicase